MSLEQFGNTLFQQSRYRPDYDRISRRIAIDEKLPVRSKTVDGTIYFFTDNFIDESRVNPLIRQRIANQELRNDENRDSSPVDTGNEYHSKTQSICDSVI
jgi:hypothetical protein